MREASKDAAFDPPRALPLESAKKLFKKSFLELQKLLMRKTIVLRDIIFLLACRFKVLVKLFQKLAGCRGRALTKKTLRFCFTASK